MIPRKKRKHCVREGKPLVSRTSVNQEWALDFVHDAVACGRAIRVLSVVDANTRECLALEVDTNFASRRVTRVLDAIIAERGMAGAIRCDNGPEFTGRHFPAWCVERKIELVHIHLHPVQTCQYPAIAPHNLGLELAVSCDRIRCCVAASHGRLAGFSSGRSPTKSSD